MCLVQFCWFTGRVLFLGETLQLIVQLSNQRGQLFPCCSWLAELPRRSWLSIALHTSYSRTLINARRAARLRYT
jgi:hypothetical protein